MLGTDSVEESVYSIAVNTRRIFIVLLTGLLFAAVVLTATLISSFAIISDPDDYSGYANAILITPFVGLVVLAVGILYAVRSKRLSHV
ncbi:MAG: hypothetical protein JSV90_01465 [Methanobacteriota archaeon]|nr:MAG: hypothetical protein JSV90_01465 [Euryarchaeota archaeon]